MQLFYNPNIDQHVTTFSFDREESKHIIKVLRKKDNDTLYVTNGIGYLFTTQIILASENKCTVQLISFEEFKKPQASLHLAVAPTKMNERYEWFLEKATEIGVSEITPIIGDHSERKTINHERFSKIILAAMKQSNQYFLPKLNEAVSFKTFIEKILPGQKYIAYCEEGNKQPLKEKIITNTDMTILIGPEGDFSLSEISHALKNGFSPVSLGNTRLRTETAAIVACHTFAFINETIIQ